MQARELMTADPACCTTDDTLEHAAKLMRENDCGAIPVCESENPGRVVGMVTDRDLAVRGLADGRGPDTDVRQCMSSDVHSCAPDSSVDEVEETMARHQIRRVPIIDADGKLLGIVAQADLALASNGDVSDEDVGEVVETISHPTKMTPARGDD